MLDQHRTAASVALAEPPPRLPCRAADARRAVERAVTERCRARSLHCPPRALADAVLVTSELATNALVHGGGITGFDVDVDPAGVRVSVSDRSDAFPMTRPAADRREGARPGGHGWPLVRRLARDVRVAELPRGGKRITAVVPLH
ncbi:ATP-binding protein [Streptomyces sp. NPDC100445]|uniref:ATP-binding protein n=1 Tax=Streptomyces sp. NPDC100445 TaxID=3366102 RepID=UPI0037FF647F